MGDVAAAETVAGGSIEPVYADWRRYNTRIVAGLRGLTANDLTLSAAPDGWPVWAIAAHTAGARIYWLCGVFGEPGSASTPFPAADGEGWEDHLETTRTAAELVGAFESSWRIVEGCLRRWTVPMLDEVFERPLGDRVQRHTRQSVLLRLITHDAFHAGEIAQILGANGRPQFDLWPPQHADPAANEARAAKG